MNALKCRWYDFRIFYMYTFKRYIFEHFLKIFKIQDYWPHVEVDECIEIYGFLYIRTFARKNI